MRATKKRVEALKTLKKYGINGNSRDSEHLYDQLRKSGYSWDSKNGEWVEAPYPKADMTRVRVIAEPENVKSVVSAVVEGLESNGWLVLETSSEYGSGNHPKYKGQTAVRVYVKAVKFNGGN